MQNFQTEIYDTLVRVIPVSVPIDAIAQMFTAAILITTVAICVAGFIILLAKLKMRDLDKAIAIFLTGVFYFGFGLLFYVLGSRAIPIAFIPVSLGASYLFGTRLKPYLASLFLVLLILFSFIPLHASFTQSIHFSTRESYTSENFFIDHYDWTKHSYILADFWVADYFESKIATEAYTFAREPPTFARDPQVIREVDTIFYTVGLGIDLHYVNYTIEETIYEEKLNVVYNSGSSIVTTRR
jgi:hypothetical protein